MPNKHVTHALQKRFNASFRELARPEAGDGVVAAFSGGADSTALLCLGLRFARDTGLKVWAAHLDHMLRGEESTRDRLACESLAEKLDVPFIWERIDVRRAARTGSQSLETAAREVRYEFLENVRGRTGARFIMTGHTADDNVETLLLNLLRGAGPQGLCGMPPVRGPIVRPLLTFWREELTAHLLDMNIGWVEDGSNLDSVHVRNRIRRDLLPRLREDYNPSAGRVLERLTHLMRDEEKIWDRLLAEAGAAAGWSEEGDRVSLDANGLNGLEKALARRLVRAGVAAVKGNTMSLGLDHVAAVLDLAAGDCGGMDLPGGIRAWCEEGRVWLGVPPPPETNTYNRVLEVPGRVEIPEQGLVITAEFGDGVASLPEGAGPDRVVMNQEAVNPPLRVRNAEPGDRFRPLGMEGTKKLSDFFTDLRIPSNRRWLRPLVVDDNGIIWVVGLRADERVRIAPAHTRVIILTRSEL